ncbi:hypothetical protein KC19_2G148900 [Ceratodon purpureus]|uniref:Uncharacterized protein n=1 Tax=Ceratodon purpureus TaxID=3225 RepID=A0A8T0IVN4_CERPU|nr:hypothetical protein KC19_2G148900 [Ceratodon purpureus]
MSCTIFNIPKSYRGSFGTSKKLGYSLEAILSCNPCINLGDRIDYITGNGREYLNLYVHFCDPGCRSGDNIRAGGCVEEGRVSLRRVGRVLLGSEGGHSVVKADRPCEGACASPSGLRHILRLRRGGGAHLHFGVSHRWTCGVQGVAQGAAKGASEGVPEDFHTCGARMDNSLQ